MVCMSTKNLSQTHKLIARSMRRTCEAVEDAVRDAQRADIKFRGRKLGNEAWINSAVRYFLSMPMDAQHEALRANLAAIAADLEIDDENEGTERPEPIGHYTLSEIVDLNPVSPAKPHRKHKGTNSPKPPARKP